MNNASSRLTPCLLALSIVSVSCEKQKPNPSNNGPKETLSGTWKIAKWDRPNFVEATITFSNGNWKVHGKFSDRSNSIEPVESGGTFETKNGWLVMTMLTNNAITNGSFPPSALGYQITHQSDRELTLIDTNYAGYGDNGGAMLLHKEEN